MSKPTVGRMVHFVLADGITIRPATITTATSDVCVNLSVDLEPGDEPHNARFYGQAPLCLTGQPHTWHWPDRV